MRELIVLKTISLIVINRLTRNFRYKESAKADDLLETYTKGTCELVERKIF